MVEPDDEVGLALGAGDFNRDRFLDLAVGALARTTAPLTAAGRSTCFPGRLEG